MSEQAPAEKPATPALRPVPATPPAVGSKAARPTLLRRRFLIAYAVLAAVLGAGIGAVVLMTTEKEPAAPLSFQWSSWVPSAQGTVGVRQIAARVAPQYRLDNGNQLVGVVGGSMVLPTENGTVPVSAILVGSGNAAVPNQRYEVDIPEAGAFFQMCGAGANCTIPGESSPIRGQLIRRQATELALYTFRYNPEADHVFVFIPPPPGVQPTNPLYARVVHFRRDHLAAGLSVPLDEALPAPPPPYTPNTFPDEAGRAIDDLTRLRVFHYEFQQAQDQTAFMFLTPLEFETPAG